jgi:DNA primase catalytic subunit
MTINLLVLLAMICGFNIMVVALQFKMYKSKVGAVNNRIEEALKYTTSVIHKAEKNIYEAVERINKAANFKDIDALGFAIGRLNDVTDKQLGSINQVVIDMNSATLVCRKHYDIAVRNLETLEQRAKKTMGDIEKMKEITLSNSLLIDKFKDSEIAEQIRRDAVKAYVDGQVKTDIERDSDFKAHTESKLDTVELYGVPVKAKKIREILGPVADPYNLSHVQKAVVCNNLGIAYHGLVAAPSAESPHELPKYLEEFLNQTAALNIPIITKIEETFGDSVKWYELNQAQVDVMRGYLNLYEVKDHLSPTPGGDDD